MAVLGEDARCEEIRRIAGDRGGVTPPAPCSELSDVRECSDGVVERSLLPIELELGVLRSGGFVELFLPDGEALPCLSGAIVWATGEEAGRAVAAAVDNESRFMLPVRAPASLFVD